MICYKRLWKLLIDRNMKQKELCALTGLSPSTIAKLKHNENVNVEVLDKICVALSCTLDDIAEIDYKKTNDKD